MIETDVLPTILKWSEAEDRVRAVILVGSRAKEQSPDHLADFDIQLFATDYEGYVSDPHWISAIGDVWVCIHDSYYDVGGIIPTRLVIYERGIKVDFAFYRAEILQRMKWTGPYKVLLDKDVVVSNSGEIFENRFEPVLTQEEFTRVVEEFWFEAYHIAKYLKREELWLAKSRDWATKAFLLRMIQWNEGTRGNQLPSIQEDGGNLQSLGNTSTRSRLPGTFGHFDAADSWNALLSMLNLFRDLARETSAKLKLAYPQKVDDEITNFILTLSKSQRG